MAHNNINNNKPNTFSVLFLIFTRAQNDTDVALSFEERLTVETSIIVSARSVTSFLKYPKVLSISLIGPQPYKKNRLVDEEKSNKIKSCLLTYFRLDFSLLWELGPSSYPGFFLPRSLVKFAAIVVVPTTEITTTI